MGRVCRAGEARCSALQGVLPTLRAPGAPRAAGSAGSAAQGGQRRRSAALLARWRAVVGWAGRAGLRGRAGEAEREAPPHPAWWAPRLRQATRPAERQRHGLAWPGGAAALSRSSLSRSRPPPLSLFAGWVSNVQLNFGGGSEMMRYVRWVDAEREFSNKFTLLDQGPKMN